MHSERWSAAADRLERIEASVRVPGLAPEPMDAATMADRERRVRVYEGRIEAGYRVFHPKDAKGED